MDDLNGKEILTIFFKFWTQKYFKALSIQPKYSGDHLMQTIENQEEPGDCFRAYITLK